MQKTPIIVWLRNDLRLDDNPALFYAAKEKCPLIILYIYSEEDQKPYPIGSASKWWLHHSLHAFSLSIENQLIIRKGNPVAVIREIAKESTAKALFLNQRLSPHEIAHDQQYEKELRKDGIICSFYDGNALIDPATLFNRQEKPFQVFKSFYTTACNHFNVKEPLGKPAFFEPYKKIKSLSISELDLLPKIHWTKGLEEAWTPGEITAEKKLSFFCTHSEKTYVNSRDIPSIYGTSRLSPHLHFGEISIRKVYQKAHLSDYYRRELYFREFAHYLLFHFPELPKKPFHARFEKFSWKNDALLLHAWQKGHTGYPIVDAGMRELWQTGWMHNRVRMIVGSFLVKHLLISWQEGLNWFWDTLVDADLANNSFGWQWVAGCGIDAAPYFRIFNPILQGEKFDPDGLYVKKYVPELALVPAKYIHKPWKLSVLELEHYNVELGKNYPKVIIDHEQARASALEQFKKI